MPIQTSEPARGPANAAGRSPLLLRALRGEPVERPRCGSCARPAARCPSTARCAARPTLMEITHEPELTAEVTLQPVRRHGVDAAILFSDIVTPLEAIGVGVEIRPGVGPVIAAADP